MAHPLQRLIQLITVVRCASWGIHLERYGLEDINWRSFMNTLTISKLSSLDKFHCNPQPSHSSGGTQTALDAQQDTAATLWD